MNSVEYKKKILITGTSSGIGFATTKYLSQRNCLIYAGVRTEKDYEMWLGQNNIIPVMLDITVKEDILALVQLFKQEGVVLDAVINNAGVTCWGPILEVEDDLALEPFRVNLFGTRLVIKHILPFLSPKEAKIINIGSNSARTVLPFHGPYPLSKLALRGLTDGLRRELLVLGKQHIKVVLIEPGSIVTPMWDKALKNISFPLNSESNVNAHKIGVFLTEDDMKNSPGPEIVAELLHQVLLREKPKWRYDIGRHKVTMIIFSWLPKRFVDRLIQIVLKSMIKKMA